MAGHFQATEDKLAFSSTSDNLLSKYVWNILRPHIGYWNKWFCMQESKPFRGFNYLKNSIIGIKLLFIDKKLSFNKLLVNYVLKCTFILKRKLKKSTKLEKNKMKEFTYSSIYI